MNDAEPTDAPLKHDRPAGSADSERSRLPQVAEAALFCPSCRYNLTGLPENRCPECGFRFSWAYLREAARLAMPWETKRSIKSFFLTCHRSMFTPQWLVAAVDREFDATAAWQFSLLCFLLATVPSELFTFATGFLTSKYDALKATSAVNFGLLIAFLTCNPIAAAALSCLPDPRRRSFRFWHGIMHYLSCFAVGTGVLVLIGVVALASGSLFAPAAVFIPVVLLGWVICWVMCVGSVVSAVCEFGDRSLWGALIALVIGGCCVALAAGITFLLVAF